MAKIRLGKDAEITGAGLVNAQVRNVTIDFSKAEADVSTRGGDGYRATVGTLKECQIECEVVVREHADIADVRAAFEDGTAQTITFTDGGGALTNKFEVMALSIAQELEGAIIASVTLKTTAPEVS
jgi:predicted secreted protein